MDLGLSGARVLITGSSRGIGYGIAQAFLKEGADVVITARDEGELSQACGALSACYPERSVEYFAGDLGDSRVRIELCDFLERKGLSHCICNLGSGKSVPILNETYDEWHRMFDVNLVYATELVKVLIPLLGNNKNWSSLIFVGSICGIKPIGCPLAYGAAKAALLSYMKNLAAPLAKKRIRVNLISPGNIMFFGSTWEEKLEKNYKKVQEMLEKEVPMKKLGAIDDVANAALFLSSECANFILGENLVVDGGQTVGK